MEAYFLGIVRKQEARIKALELEIARAHAETVTVRNHWIEVTEDLDKECQKKLIKAEKRFQTVVRKQAGNRVPSLVIKDMAEKSMFQQRL